MKKEKLIKLENLRRKIDQIDAQIIKNLEKRLSLVQEINELKNDLNLPLTSPKREKEIITRLQELTSSKFLQEYLPFIYEPIFKLSKDLRLLNLSNSLSFQKIGVIGLGIIGGSIVKTLKTKNSTLQIYSLKSKTKDLILAKKQNWLDKIFPLKDLVINSELLILALPIEFIIPFAYQIKSFENYVTKKLIVIDVASIKKEISFHFEKLTSQKIEFLGTHPMAGSDKSGFEYSRLGLFLGYPWIITPHSQNLKETISKIQEFILYLGSHPYLMSPEDHDKIVAKISHLVFIISTLLFAYVYETDKQSLKYAGTGFKSTTRLASGNPYLHSQIFVKNYQKIKKEFFQFLKFLKSNFPQKQHSLKFFQKYKKLRDRFYHEN